MITAKKAFDGPTQANVIGAILKDEPPPIIEIVPDAPVSLDHALARCLAKDPDDRWQTANDLLFELRSIASPAAAGVRGSRALSRRVERALWMALVIAAIAGAGFWAQSRDVRPGAPTGRHPRSATRCSQPTASRSIRSTVRRWRCPRTAATSSMWAPRPTDRHNCGFARCTRSANRRCQAPKGRTHHSGRPTASGLDSSPQTA